MKITIIHSWCPLCEMAIQEFKRDGHEVEMYRDFLDIPDLDRRISMHTDLLYAKGDPDSRPLVFAYDRYIPWQPKKGKSNGQQ